MAVVISTRRRRKGATTLTAALARVVEEPVVVVTSGQQARDILLTRYPYVRQPIGVTVKRLGTFVPPRGAVVFVDFPVQYASDEMKSALQCLHDDPAVRCIFVGSLDPTKDPAAGDRWLTVGATTLPVADSDYDILQNACFHGGDQAAADAVAIRLYDGAVRGYSKLLPVLSGLSDRALRMPRSTDDVVYAETPAATATATLLYDTGDRPGGATAPDARSADNILGLVDRLHAERSSPQEDPHFVLAIEPNIGDLRLAEVAYNQRMNRDAGGA